MSPSHCEPLVVHGNCIEAVTVHDEVVAVFAFVNVLVDDL